LDAARIQPRGSLETIMREELLGTWRRQVELGDSERWCGRVDFRSTTWPLIVEVQSERYHTALSDRAHDAARRKNLEDAGFVVLEVWDTQIWHGRSEVVSSVREGIAKATARRSAA
jgi:very-short-patch-repair endonuclease